MSYVEKHAMELNIGGRLRISREGINATITGEKENVQQFCTKLQEFDPHFLETDFKYIDNMPLDRAFKDMKVLPVKELVFYGIDSTRDLGEGGK
jgi:predicted sulfurtransferase